MQGAGEVQPVVFVVDASLRASLAELFASVGCVSRRSARRSNSWAASFPTAPAVSCSTVRLPGLSGLDFQAELAKANAQLPIIFITGHGDIPMTVRQ
jgi:FixJ family two-component response regulator